ncbi:uncharacterized protein TRAVEDRAFT_43692 [Trametes versicolor FP-101664 SS1]|uniref:uncharacterized protein n=1 Tax=Trametes versicolor (strain FP-101664) TaxID=717944 RepID=UPI00046246C0|nr:uncharacterized protein TRAVEDRAFT_43692 [Trametes versicolor FP-101664 SS1]EIW63395.1 hypothetical protein TRAVEDRAFT_43692 [Trametes versicolor FP-101664 SS1]
MNTSGFMDRLPPELVANVFDYVQAAHALSAAMLVNRQWYMHGARNLHARLVLRIGLNMSIDSQHAVMSLMKRLVSPTLSTAPLVRHLVVDGVASAEVHILLLDILHRATGLRSLNVWGLGLTQNRPFFPPDAFSTPHFLPSIVAFNVKAGFAPYLGPLIHARRIHALRVHEAIDDVLLRRITDSSGTLASGIHSLELVISAQTGAVAVERMEHLASALESAPLRALAVQFRIGSVSWIEFEDAIGQMGPSLRKLGNLSILGLTTSPDPIMHVSDSAELGTGKQRRERMTRSLAERLIADHGLSRLSRIDLRWHGWKVKDGQLHAVAESELLRQPANWVYKQFSIESP